MYSIEDYNELVKALTETFTLCEAQEIALKYFEAKEKESNKK